MKKLSLLIILLLASIVMVSCTGTQADGTEDAGAPSEMVESAVITEPIEQQTEVVEQDDMMDTVVIDTSMERTADDPQIEEKFSYVYGHLLGDGIVNQGISLVPRYFIAGSTDFYNYVDPLLTEQQINTLFMQYQSYLDGAITEEEMEAVDIGPIGDMSTFQDLFSYGYGYVVQYNLQSQGILVVLESYHNGIADAFSGVPLNYTDEEIDSLFVAYQDKLMAEYYEMVEEFAAQNLADAEAFLAENALEEGVITTDSGLQYKVVSRGDGPLPTSGDTVELDYMLTFLDGSVGDSSYSRGSTAVFDLGRLVPGFSEGVQLMPVGSHFRFYVHPGLGYQEEGTQDIPPNTLLIFDVELHDIVD